LRILFTAEEIAARTRVLAEEILSTLGDDFVLSPVLTGGFIFGADLLRALQEAGADPEVDFVQLASYGAGRESSGLVRVVKDFTLPLEDRTVLLVDDVLDSGRSLARAKAMLAERRVSRAAVAVAVRKEKERAVEIEADFALFEAPGDAFLVGYGMDDAGRSRGIPSIGRLD
jgi:hypoxanthine phosphoribosyltransferase